MEKATKVMETLPAISIMSRVRLRQELRDKYKLSG
jgi:hypothetical protein